MTRVEPDVVADAWADAQAAAARAGVEVRILAPAEAPAAAALLERLWAVPVVEAPLMVALAHCGGYVAGAFRDGRLVGVCVGLLARPHGEAMHSHVAGVLPEEAGGGVGTAMKLHQRAWCLDEGLTRLTWTFDPLVVRNAMFNTRRLGAELTDYLVDFYGRMTDGVNAGQGSDRMVATWHLDAPLPRGDTGEVPAASSVPTASSAVAHEALGIGPGERPETRPVPADAEAVVLCVPADIEDLRRRDPAVAAAWRPAFRDAIRPLLAGGWHVTSVAREGRYRLERR
ncbi:GNAT family N-acetyltransferase [Demequina mangrovi]|uniref:Predicted acetyltransferase, GNAT superfamily n=1 Tax=Demequina mangrovi TaxID=1043493 RepID=A0A1H6YTS5_9MICO|nr:GNAT family N-acetyltransferase [Demequina mangrovi]SEJ44649.1 Predicted acetyltransferase, GNAT superfamily [Demequina mangrovi]